LKGSSDDALSKWKEISFVKEKTGEDLKHWNQP